MTNISISGTRFLIPQRWNELTREQFRIIVEVLSAPVLYDAALLNLFLRFSGLKVMQQQHEQPDFWILVNQKSKTKNQKFVLSTWQLVELSACMKWIFEPVNTPATNGTDTKLEHAASCKLTRNLLPRITLHSPLSTLHYFGPSDALANLRFSEYIYAETAHRRYLESGDDRDLHELVATLWRPRRFWLRKKSVKWNGDPRRAFNPFLTDRYVRRVATADPVELRMILMWYQACGLLLQKKFPDMYTRVSAEVKKNKSKNRAAAETFESFMKMVNSLADDDVTRKDAIREAYLYDALETLNDMVRRNKELETRNPKHRTR